MSFESLKSTVEDNLDPMDFARGLLDSALHQPLKAIDQLRGKEIATDSHKNESLATKAGNMAGAIVDLALIAKCSGAALVPLLGEALETTAGQAAKMFVVGGVYGGVLTPSRGDRGLLTGRLEQGLVSASTFAVMGGVGKALEGTATLKGAASLESTANLGGKSLLPKVINNAIGGSAGGVVQAYGSVYFDQHRRASLGEVLNASGQYAAMGAGFGALDHGLSLGAERLGKVPAVESAYWRTRSAVREGSTEAKRMGWSTLDRLDMRHPLQRVGDLVYGTEVADNVPKPALTALNNPITSIAKEIPAYFNEIQRLDDLPNDTVEGRESYDKITQTQSAFAYKLLALWHGTADQPGIASHTDAELATPEIPIERVAQIRQALTSSAKKEYPNASPFTQALGHIAGVEVGSGHNYFEIGDVGSLDQAKEKFFNYDWWELKGRMAMPSETYYMKRAYGRSQEWLPFEATDNLPNFFHGTVSSSLPSLFTERTLFSSKELRLRGIPQVAGESATETFPRRSVSITTDFGEAFAYHRHSPSALNTFPVVLGISKDVIPRAREAGMLEPGETLVDKVRVGNSLMTRLGLRQPELTHMYVPDNVVSHVVQQMARHRIDGVQVIGFSQLQAPQWNPVSLEDLQRY